MKLNTKRFKKFIFSMLLLIIGLVTVEAAEADPVNIMQYHSKVTSIDTVAANNCIANKGATNLDIFTSEDGKVCVVTGKTIGEYGMVAEADHGSGGKTFYGEVVANTDTGTTLTLPKLVQIIYTSEFTNNVKTTMLSDTVKPDGATTFTIKLGSSENALYVNGAYDTGLVINLKYNYDTATKRLTLLVERNNDDDNALNYQIAFARVFSNYLVDYLMEASPNYDSAYDIMTTTGKKEKVTTEFVKKYGTVQQLSSESNTEYAGVKVDLLVSEQINNDIITIYEEATTTPTPEEPEEPEVQDPEDNPNTGAFINIFSIVALLSVGTVMILGNRRKIFKV